MPLLGKKKKKVRHYNPTFYQAHITEYQVDFLDAIYSGNPEQRLKKLKGKINTLMTQVRKERMSGSIKNIPTFLVLETRLGTLKTLIEMILKRYKEIEELTKTSEVSTQETTGKDNYIQ
jgi:hypothetical protein